MRSLKSDWTCRRPALRSLRSNLVKLLAWRPSSDEAAYLLGVCEMERGRNQAAADAWARVEPGSAHSERALLARMQLFYNSGQLSAAEQFVDDASLDPRNEKTGVRILLVPIYRQLGRLDDAKRLIEARWEYFNEIGEGATERAIQMVRVHIELDLASPPAVGKCPRLSQPAARQAPDDDRVWLGERTWRSETGSHDEAKRWLDACQSRRPDDVPVWRARLSWGLATNRIDVVQEALKHLPAAESTPAQLHRLSAWLFSHQGDVASERRELVRLIAADPADLTALDRLAQLAEKDGRPAHAAELLRKKAEIERLRARYEKLDERKQPVRNAVEMASLAEKLGRDVRGSSLSHPGDRGKSPTARTCGASWRS